MEHNYKHTLAKNGASPVPQMVKNSPANVGDTEMWVGSLGQDGPLEKDLSVCDHFDYVAFHYMNAHEFCLSIH